MDLKEAIRHCREVAAGATAQGKCPECAADHAQLADWLEELVRYRGTMVTPEDLMGTFNEEAILRMAARVLDMTPDRLQELAQAERDGRLVVIPRPPQDGDNAVLTAVFRGQERPVVMHGGGDIDDLIALTHLLVSYTAEVTGVSYAEFCQGMGEMEPTTGFGRREEDT